MARGRSSLQDLCLNSGLAPAQVRHGLAILTQQSLLYHYTDEDKRQTTWYEANPRAAYNIIRIGKIVELVAQDFGDDAAELVQTLSSLGNARLLDLQEAYVARHHASEGRSRINGAANGDNSFDSDDNPFEHYQRQEGVTEKLSNSVYELLEHDILELCTPRSFNDPKDVRAEVEKEILRTHFHGSPPKGAKAQDQFLGHVREKLLEYRDEPQRLKSQLIHKLQNARSACFSNKKRKLENGTSAKDFVSCADADVSVFSFLPLILAAPVLFFLPGTCLNISTCSPTPRYG